MSACKGLSLEDCNKLVDCMFTTGIKRKYCRKSKTKKLKMSTPNEYGPVKGRCRKGFRKNKTTKMCIKKDAFPVDTDIPPEKDKTILDEKPFVFYAGAKLDNNNDYRFSNFYHTNCYYKGIMYPSTEHAYQAQKFPKKEHARFAIGGDLATFDAFSFFYKEKDIPKKIKFWGKKNMIGIIAKLAQNNWRKTGLSKISKVSQSIFYPMLLDKFTRNIELREKLLATGDRYLVEFCRSGERRERQGKGRERWCAYAKEISKNKYRLFGENRMGVALMYIRSYIRNH